VWGFPGGGGAVLGGAGQPADLEQGVGVALGGGARIGDVPGGWAGCGELLDEGAERGAVLRLQESVESEPSVAALPEPELPRSGGGFGLVAGWGAVGVEVGEDVPPDCV
jgi:hypothetical protein